MVRRRRRRFGAAQPSAALCLLACLFFQAGVAGAEQDGGAVAQPAPIAPAEAAVPDAGPELDEGGTPDADLQLELELERPSDDADPEAADALVDSGSQESPRDDGGWRRGEGDDRDANDADGNDVDNQGRPGAGVDFGLTTVKGGEDDAVVPKVSTSTSEARAQTTLPTFPARHRGEVLPPLLPPERWVATRTTVSFFAEDLVGFQSLWNDSPDEPGDIPLHPRFGLSSNLVAYGRIPTETSVLRLDGAVVARLLLPSETRQPTLLAGVIDDGSYLRSSWTPFGVVDSDLSLQLTIFPLSSDRLRLGHLHDVSWGGDEVYFTPHRITPGLRIGIDWWGAYAFAAGKMVAMLPEANRAAPRPVGSALAGVGVDLFDMLALETGVGWFRRGNSPNPGTLGEPLPAYGVSTRAALHFGRSAVLAPDYSDLRRDLAMVDVSLLGQATRNPSDINGLLALEHGWMGGTSLTNDDPTATVFLPSQSLALSGRLDLYFLSFALDATYREAAWLSHGELLLLSMIASDVVDEPELRLAGSVAVSLPSLESNLALVGAIELPPTIETFPQAPSSGRGVRTVVMGREGLHILPDGETRAPNGTLELLAHLNIGPLLSVVASVGAVANGNETRLVGQGPDIDARARITTFGLPYRIESAAELTAQLRF